MSEEPGAPVGEASEDYRAWARSWARVRRHAQIRLFVAVALAVVAGSVALFVTPSCAHAQRRRAVDDAIDDVANCCFTYGRGFPSSCDRRLPAAAEALDAGMA